MICNHVLILNEILEEDTKEVKELDCKLSISTFSQLDQSPFEDEVQDFLEGLTLVLIAVQEVLNALLVLLEIIREHFIFDSLT